MEAIVLAGGFGTRLREVVSDVPKPMAPIAGRPFLEILLESLSRKGFERVILSLGFMADKISGHFGEKFAGMDLVYVVEPQPLGTGGAIRLSLSHCHQDHVYVFNGDTFLDLDIGALEAHWQKYRFPIVVGRIVSDTTRYGRLLVADGRVCGFNEKGQAGAGLINAGCYVFNQGQLDDFTLNTQFSLEVDYLSSAVASQPFDVFSTDAQFIDIGVPEDFKLAQSLLAGFV